jgi:23S rRNA (adenine2503-C2)-methyltransferase
MTMSSESTIETTTKPQPESNPGPSKHVLKAIAQLEKLEEQRRAGAEVEPGELIDLMDFSVEELREFVTEGMGERKFRANQLFQWIYSHLAEDIDQMSNLSKDFRARLSKIARLAPIEFQGIQKTGADGTSKLTFKCDDNAIIETVLIPSANRNTLCISSQVGCAMGCTFCFTAKMGLRRHLTTAEIVGQVVLARRHLAEEIGHIGNIVFMGMGEPLHNYDNVVRAVHILTNQKGLDFSRRRVTVSTSGLVPQIEKFGRDTDVQLAISLNGTNDEQRSKLMPVNDRWGIDELIDVVRSYPLEKRERVTFEFVMIKGITDRLEDAERLVKLVDGLPCKVNLIPFNPHPGTPFQTPDEKSIDAFQDYLIEQGIHVLRRKTRGRDEMAACGQLGKPGDRKLPRHLRTRLEQFQKEADHG